MNAVIKLGEWNKYDKIVRIWPNLEIQNISKIGCHKFVIKLS